LGGGDVPSENPDIFSTGAFPTNEEASLQSDPGFDSVPPVDVADQSPDTSIVNQGIGSLGSNEPLNSLESTFGYGTNYAGGHYGSSLPEYG
jgi:hypothetical protein